MSILPLPDTSASEPAVTETEVPVPPSEEEETQDLPLHTCRLLMLQQYDNAQTAERIRSSVRQGIENNQNKLEVLKWLIQSDPNRARLTLQELQNANQRLLQAADTIIGELEQGPESQRPIWMAVDDCIQHYRTLYPDCTIDAAIDCADYDLKILPILTQTLIRLLKEVTTAFIIPMQTKS